MSNPAAMVVDATFDQIKATLGWMSAAYPYEDNVAFLHDDDGIARNRLPNRTINGEIMPGPFFIVGINDSGDLTDLPDEFITHYLEMYKEPEIFAPGHWEVSSTVEETEYTAIIKIISKWVVSSTDSTSSAAQKDPDHPTAPDASSTPSHVEKTNNDAVEKTNNDAVDKKSEAIK